MKAIAEMTDLEYRRKKRAKLVWTILIAIVLLLITMFGALAYSLDTYEDSVYVKRGDSIQNSFIIENYIPDTILKSNLALISLDKDKYISERIGVGTLVVDDNYVFYYYITIPKDADIGIYRGVIEVKSGTETKVLNVKINVQNNVVNGMTKTLQNPKSRWPTLSIIIFTLMLILFITYLRVRRRK